MSHFGQALIVTLCLCYFLGGANSNSAIDAGVPCPPAHFRDADTHTCRPCSTSCPQPLVAKLPCRQDADIVCDAAPDVRAGAVALTTARVLRLCPFDAFVNLETGLCQECTRYCQPPLVLTSPCQRLSDAVCGIGPKMRRPSKARGASSRRRKSRKDRKRKKKDRKKSQLQSFQGAKPKGVYLETSSQLCMGEGDQFYDHRRDQCVPCRNCDLPGLREALPCTSSRDRVCTVWGHSGDGQSGARGDFALTSNEYPEKVGTRRQNPNRSHNNEYQDSRLQLHHDNGQRPPGILGLARENTSEMRDGRRKGNQRRENQISAN